jgi:hypothetical protein
MYKLSVSQSLLVRPLITGVLNGVAMASSSDLSSLYVSPLGNVAVPTWLAFAAVGFGSNLIAGSITQNLLPKLTENPMILNNTMIVEPVVSGLANIGLSYVVNPKLMSDESFGPMKLFLYGSGSEVLASYASNYLYGFH